MKYGLWEDGKRIEWFDKETAQSIKDHKYDFTGHFKRQESAYYLEDQGSFNRPYNFDIRLKNVKARFGIPT